MSEQDTELAIRKRQIGLLANCLSHIQNSPKAHGDIRVAATAALVGASELTKEIATTAQPLREERPYAYCCNGDPKHCDCVHPNHGTAFFEPTRTLTTQPPVSGQGGAEVRAALDDLLRQLDVADAYARAAKPKKDGLPSVWEIQNGHLREYARVIALALPAQSDAGEVEGWHPIETAPSETLVLVLMHEGGEPHAPLLRCLGWKSEELWFPGEDEAREGDPELYTPIGWAPLPALPRAALTPEPRG